MSASVFCHGRKIGLWLVSPRIMCVQYRGLLSTLGVFSTVGGYHDKCGGISWVPWDVQYRGGYHEYRGGYLEYLGECSVPWGISWCRWGITWVPWRVFSTVGENLLLFEYPKVPPRHWTTSMVLMISPTVLKFQRMVSPTVLNTLHGTHDIPNGTHDIPTVLNTPTVLSTPTVLHTHYTGWV